MQGEHQHLPEEDKSAHTSVDTSQAKGAASPRDGDEENVRFLNMVTLYFSCRHLVNLDVTSLTDPLVKCYTREDKCPEWTYVGETETLQNTLDPVFMTSLKINYYFEKQQWLKFEVYNADPGRKAELVGQAEALMGEIMSEKKHTWKKDLELPDQKVPGKKKRGVLIVKPESDNENNHELIMEVKATLASQRSFFFCGDHDDPYLLIERFN